MWFLPFVVLNILSEELPRRTLQNRPFVDGPQPAISPAAETTEFYFVASSEFCAVI